MTDSMDFGLEDEVWGLKNIARVLGYHPRHVYRLKKQYESTEPIPMYFRTVGRGKKRKRLYWSTADELRRWLRRILATDAPRKI